jgi:peptidylprolyl isomerase
MTLSMRARTTAAVALMASSACASAPQRVATPGIIPPVAGAPRDLGNIRVIDIVDGSGVAYAPRRCIYTHYTGWLADGTKFDASRDTSRSSAAAEPVAFAQGRKQVIDAWDIGFDGVRVGGVRRLFVPRRMGYGARGNPPVIPARSDLVFDVELMAIADTLPHRSGPVVCPDWRIVRPRG